MTVIHIDDEEALQREFTKVPGDRLVVIDFTATWCGPCKMIGPIYDELSAKYRGVSFLKVDIDECPDIAMKYQVTAMPTFVFFKNSKEIDRLRGADSATLEAKLKSHGGPNALQGLGFSGSGQRLGFNSDTSTQDTSGAGLGGWLGSWLGSGNSSVSSNQNHSQNQNQNQNHSVPTSAVDNEKAAKTALKTDPNLPTTKIQLRLADGSKLTIQVNLITPVSKIREFICLVRPDYAEKEFSLNTTTSFPVREIPDENISIENAGLANSVLVLKPKI